MKQNIKMHIAYDGTRYLGFQRLGDHELTIQERLETILTKYFSQEIKVIGSSRTDAGVHAYDQIINFHVDTDISIKEMQVRLNQMLPEDIVIQKIEVVDESFHSRYYSEKKSYLYRIYINPIPPLFERKYVYHLGLPLDIEKMKQACSYLIGTHNFQGFCKRKMIKSTIRTLYECSIIEQGHEVQILVVGDGFLYNMVRIIVGTLIEIGLNKRELSSITQIFTELERAQAGYLVPATGLILVKNDLLEKK